MIDKMKIIKPYFKIEHITPNALEALERYGRTCYKSEDRITPESSLKFIDMLVNNYRHLSVIEHAIMTVRFVVDRGVSHELVRHRIGSYSQESTRYCNYCKEKFGEEITVIWPDWMDSEARANVEEMDKLGLYDDTAEWIDGDNVSEQGEWFLAMKSAEKRYFNLIKKGWKPQQARHILPTGLKTEIVVTYNFRQWIEVFQQRTSPQAHPQIREVMIPLLKEAKEKIPIIFDGIEVKDK